MIERENRVHDDPHHPSNWCIVCGLYYCWHPECKTYKNDGRANHKFEPATKKDMMIGIWKDEELLS